MSLARSLPYRLTLALVVIVHLAGLLTDITMGDSALYAIVAKEMALGNDYLQLFRNGTDWLDKPHFQFWVSALSFEVFGINSFAFKLPAMLFTAMAAAYTWLLARRYYAEDVAALAVLILLTAQHLLLSNADVRAEPYLTGLIIGGVYHFALADRDERVARNVFLGSLLAAGALMTKGLFTVIPMAAAIGGAALLEGRPRSLFRPRWAVAVLLTLLLTTPELYALYYQFDLHPEKVVFDTTGVSGIRWFLWDSQFGRFFNTGPIQGKGDPTFFLHTLLWAFLPWGVLLYAGLGSAVVRTVRRRTEVAESYCLSAALVTLLVFSASRFQLPHYTNVIFPFLAIITARWIHGIATKGQERFYAVTQYGTMLLSIVAVVAVQWIFRPAVNLVPFLGLALAAVIGFVGVSRAVADRTLVVFYRTCLAAVLLSGYLQLVAYPGLLRYQSGTHAAALANAAYEGQEVLELGVNSYPLIFHLRGPVREVDFEAVARAAAAGDGPALVYTAATAIPQLEGLGLTVEVLGTFEHYHIPKLSGRFLDHRRRGGEVQARVLLRVGPGSSASEARPGLSSSA